MTDEHTEATIARLISVVQGLATAIATLNDIIRSHAERLDEFGDRLALLEQLVDPKGRWTKPASGSSSVRP